LNTIERLLKTLQYAPYFAQGRSEFKTGLKIISFIPLPPRESRDRAQLSLSREEHGDLLIFCSLCSLLFW
jgi:hypothetical protein